MFSIFKFKGNREIHKTGKKPNSHVQRESFVVDVESHPNPNIISSATKSEPFGNNASHSSGNGYKATPVNSNIIYLIQILYKNDVQ